MTMRGDPIWWAAMARDAVGFAIAATTGIIVWLRKRSSRHWPVTFRNVKSASTFQDNSVWRTDVAYSYSIGSDFYAGELQLRSSSEQKATEKELRWQGRKIGVRYSPRSPKTSVVRTEHQAGLYGGEYAGDGFPS
jgi:Protein of unknown function (DUF3592)